MTNEVRIVEKDPQLAMYIDVNISMLKIPQTLARCFQTIVERMETAGGAKAGAPYAQYLELNWESVRKSGAMSQIWQLLTNKQKMRIGIPVDSDPGNGGEVISTRLSGGRFARAVHVGAYHKLGSTYKRIAKWAWQENVSLADNAFECYVSDPGDTPTAELQTIVLVPVSNR